MAKKSSLTWMVRPAKPKKESIGVALKSKVESEVQEFAENVLRPKFVQPPPKKPKFNYVIRVMTKWIGGSLYFISTYACPGPTTISPTFEAKFARMVFVGNDKFNLSFMRHTDGSNFTVAFPWMNVCKQSILIFGSSHRLVLSDDLASKIGAERSAVASLCPRPPQTVFRNNRYDSRLMQLDCDRQSGGQRRVR